MNKLMLIFIFFSSAIFIAEGQHLPQVTKLTLMTYNIRNGLGMDNIADYNRIALVINQVNPDVVAVQELDSMTTRNSLFVLQEIARLTNMYYTYASAINYKGGKYGVGVLSKDKPHSVRKISLPGREEKRVMLTVFFDRYVFACTHLSLTPVDQQASVKIMYEELSNATDKPVLLAGDLNAVPDSKTMQLFDQHFHFLNNVSEKTFPADAPNSCIDYVLCLKNGVEVEVGFSYVLNESVASDHRPVVTGIIIPKN